MMVFNRDYQNRAPVSLQVARNVAEVFAVDEETTAETPLAIAAGEVSLALPAGGGRLLRVKLRRTK